MNRSFVEWWNSLPYDIKEKYDENMTESPTLNYVNYLWVTNLINKVSSEYNPTVEELLEWIKSEQIDAKRR